ncbi:DUF935 family protein [Methanobrevibacter sp.]|uniref:phage portal protein family protein n=1 Tax=Methanobrevibacter sp. TaxID=66852 RepID=UPI00388F7B5F
MSIISDIGNQLFKRASKISTVGTAAKKAKSYIKLFNRKDNEKSVSYETGLSILRDTQVATGFDILKYLLSSKKWILTNTEEDSEVYDFVKDMLDNMKTEINTVVKQMTPAIMWGFNVHELIFDVNDDGKLVITDIVPIHIKTLQDDPFIYNQNTGELVSIHQKVDKYEINIPEYKCLVYSFGSLYDEKEGHGLLYDFLPLVEDKENLMDWLMTFAERNGSPTMYGKTNDPNSRDELLDAFEDVSDGTVGLTVGIDEDVGILESSHNGEIFFNALQYKDNQIFRRMFIGNLLMGDNSQTGTYAQSQTQMEFGQLVFDGVLEEFANSIQGKINFIVELNFGPGRKAPLFSFDKFTSGDMKKLFEIISPLMEKGVIDSENSAVHEALALLFKAEAGVEYVNEEPEMPEEDFYQEPEPGDTGLTDEILDNLDEIYA